MPVKVSIHSLRDDEKAKTLTCQGEAGYTLPAAITPSPDSEVCPGLATASAP